MSNPIRTSEVSFERGDPDLTDTLLENRLVVIKGALTDNEVEGVATAYKLKRATLIPQRLALKAITAAGGSKENRLFRVIEPKPIEVDAQRLPLLLKAGQRAVSKIIAINAELFRDPRLLAMYGEEKQLTVANFPASFPHISGNEAFPLHQDSIGVSGLGYGMQPLPTTWSVYKWAPRLPLEIAYTFDTERGDLVALTQRTGACPDIIPRAQGNTVFDEGGSEIHSGVNETGLRRYGLGMFHQERAEEPI